MATKQEFIAEVLAEPNVIELLPNTDQVDETVGDYEKGRFYVLLNEEQGGKNFRAVWYIRNTQTDETTYQTANTINLKKNNIDAKLDALEKYCNANFLAHRVVEFTGANWAEVEVYEMTDPTITKKKVVVYKTGNNPITHKELIVV